MLSNPLALHLLHNTNSNRELTKKTFLDCNALMNFYSGQRAADKNLASTIFATTLPTLSFQSNLLAYLGQKLICNKKTQLT